MAADIAERLGATVVRHAKNLGYGAAIQSLFERAKELDADVLVTLDGDGQHDPAEISNVAKPVVDGVADIAIGSRFADRRLAYAIPWYRRAGARATINLLKHLIVEKQPVAEAVANTMKMIGEDPKYNSTLTYYPLS